MVLLAELHAACDPGVVELIVATPEGETLPTFLDKHYVAFALFESDDAATVKRSILEAQTL